MENLKQDQLPIHFGFYDALPHLRPGDYHYACNNLFADCLQQTMMIYTVIIVL